MFCLQCACVTKCIELRWCDDYEKVMEQADKLHKEIYEGDYCEYIWDVRYQRLRIEKVNIVENSGQILSVAFL